MPKVPRECMACELVKLIAGRGMCERCYRQALAEDRIIDFPTKGRKAEDTIQDVAEMAARGVNKEEVVERMGVAWHSIVAVHRRHSVDLPPRYRYRSR